MNWGHKIFISFLLFGALIITLIVISYRQNISLVSEDYYEQEIAYQSQIDRMKNFRDLDEKPNLEVNRDLQECYLTFPESLLGGKITGKVHFFRPSDAKLDRVFQIEMEEGSGIKMDLSGMQQGLWNIKVEWKDGSKEYYFEKAVYL